ncbi:MAG: YggS family pyridoxal phosphate-dependent enzyme [Desulfobacteraceae bacterium]|nr:MAG: YggS family pyridoxal phosphate-dependent enzyme [Desulfobacteraceae bacterium]
MESIKENYKEISEQVNRAARKAGKNPRDITLIAVSKKKDISVVREGIESGIFHLGENYIQEAVDKIGQLSHYNEVTWHFIGHLQSNKARFAVQYFDLIHTVDSYKLAREINKQAAKHGKRQHILLQVNIGHESSKSGTDITAIIDLARQVSVLENISVQGLMCMPPYFQDPEMARPFFRHLAQLRDEIMDLNLENIAMTHLSMGMSNDFMVAIEEGATLVRVGTAIFGERI